MSDDLDLENPDAPRSKALIAKGNAKVARRLHDDLFKADRQRLQAIIEDDDKLFLCRNRGGYLYDFQLSADHPRGLWRRLPDYLTPTPDAPWEPVFDLDAYCRDTGKEWAWRGPICWLDTSQVMMMLSVDGSDMLVGREFDLKAKAFVEGGFETPPCRQWAAWDGPDTLLVSAATSPEHATRSGWERTVRTWKRGTALDDAPIIHEAARDDVRAGAYCTPGEGGGRVLLWTSHTSRSSSLAVEIGGQRITFDLAREGVKSANDRFVIWEPLEDGDYPAGTVILRR